MAARKLRKQFPTKLSKIKLRYPGRWRTLYLRADCELKGAGWVHALRYHAALLLSSFLPSFLPESSCGLTNRAAAATATETDLCKKGSLPAAEWASSLGVNKEPSPLLSLGNEGTDHHRPPSLPPSSLSSDTLDLAEGWKCSKINGCWMVGSELYLKPIALLACAVRAKCHASEARHLHP